jgi:presenilin-like A22 family membrane protease
MRIMGVALLLAIVAVAILALGETFNIWASNGLINIAVILVFIIPLSMICFVLLAHHEQEQAKNEKGEDGSSKTP